MRIMTHATEFFEALTAMGLQPPTARRVELGFQATIEQVIDRYREQDRRYAMTKADGVALEHNLATKMADVYAKLRQEMVEMRADLRQEMAEMKAELRQEMAEMKSELRQEMAQLEHRLMRYISDHAWKMMGFQAALMGLMMGGTLTAFKYLH